MFDTSADTVKQAQQDARPQWLPEKFKTPEDFSKSYGELEKAFHDKSGVPEKYELDNVFKETGLQWQSDDRRNGLLNDLKAAGINQRQAEFLIRKYHENAAPMAQAYEARIAELSKSRDPNAIKGEINKLKTEWGGDFQNNVDQVKTWAATNLAPEVRNSLATTASGTKFIYELMKGQRGPVPLSDPGTHVGMSVDDMMTEREKVMSDPAYRGNSQQARSLQRKALELSEQIVKSRGKAA